MPDEPERFDGDNQRSRLSPFERDADVETAWGYAEVPLAGRPYAVGALAEVDAVQVGGEDLLLAVAALELAPRRVVVPVQVEELRDLLGDRARALREREVEQV